MKLRAEPFSQFQWNVRVEEKQEEKPFLGVVLVPKNTQLPEQKQGKWLWSYFSSSLACILQISRDFSIWGIFFNQSELLEHAKMGGLDVARIK